MKLDVSTWSINNPVAVTLLFILLTLAGIGGFLAMKVQDFPDIDFPVITVTAALPGASPSQLEQDVARKIEDALANLQGIRHIESTLTDGEARITAEFEVGKPVQDAMDDVRDAVARTRRNLPADLQDPSITKEDLASGAVLTYVLSSSQLDEEALSWFVDSQVGKRLLAVSGIGAVNRVGGVEREVRIELQPDRLLALNASVADISRQLRGLQMEAAGGRVDMGGAEQLVRTIATVASADAVAALDLSLSDGRRIRLDQIATVSDTVADKRFMTLMNGAVGVAFEVLRSRGAGELEVAAAARSIIAELRVAHPDIVFVEAVNAADTVQDNYAGSMLLLYEGAVLAVLVVFLFLRDWRATLIAAVALPLSVIPAFAVMHLMGDFSKPSRAGLGQGAARAGTAVYVWYMRIPSTQQRSHRHAQQVLRSPRLRHIDSWAAYSPFRRSHAPCSPCASCSDSDSKRCFSAPLKRRRVRRSSCGSA